MLTFRYNGRTRKASDFQKQTPGFCAAAAVANAFRAMDKQFAEETVTETVAACAMNLQPEAVVKGANEMRIIVGARRLGLKRIRRVSTVDLAHALSVLDEGYVILACVDLWGHWVVLLKSDGGKNVVIDSSHDKPMLSAVRPGMLERRWRNRGILYGIALRARAPRGSSAPLAGGRRRTAPKRRKHK